MDRTESVTRSCRKCGETKPLDQFDIRADTGRAASMCKDCRRTYQRERWVPTSTRSKRRVGLSELYLCTRCGQLKPAADFPRRARMSDRLHSWCRSCWSVYHAQRHQRNHDREMQRIRRNKARMVTANRALILQYLSDHPCVDCGESDSLVLEFDHLRDKIADVSRLVASGVRWDKVLAEIRKCEVRCANDHRRATRRRAREARQMRRST